MADLYEAGHCPRLGYLRTALHLKTPALTAQRTEANEKYFVVVSVTGDIKQGDVAEIEQGAWSEKNSENEKQKEPVVKICDLRGEGSRWKNT